MKSLRKTPIALAGIGKIARDQHLPALMQSDDFELVALVNLDETELDLPTYRSIEAMARAQPEIRAVSVCTPPDARLEIMVQSVAADLHVMLEKPTAATVAKAGVLENLIKQSKCSVLASWHSRHAPCVADLKKWLSSRKISKIHVSWKEDIRVWHPGQDWIFDTGYGVFDPAINAISILTEILDEPFFFSSGELFVPENQHAPIAANLLYRMGSNTRTIRCELDFDHCGAQPEWTIDVHCANGEVAHLSDGGASLDLPDRPSSLAKMGEYSALYSSFAELIAQGRSDFDVSPMLHVFDALALSKRQSIAPFQW